MKIQNPNFQLNLEFLNKLTTRKKSPTKKALTTRASNSVPFMPEFFKKSQKLKKSIQKKSPKQFQLQSKPKPQLRRKDLQSSLNNNQVQKQKEKISSEASTKMSHFKSTRQSTRQTPQTSPGSESVSYYQMLGNKNFYPNPNQIINIQTLPFTQRGSTKNQDFNFQAKYNSTLQRDSKTIKAPVIIRQDSDKITTNVSETVSYE